MRYLYRALVALTFSLLIVVLTFPIIRMIPTVISEVDVIRMKIVLSFAALVIGAYLVYYLEFLTERTVPIPMSNTTIDVAASPSEVFLTCNEVAAGLGTLKHIDPERMTMTIQIGKRRHPTLNVSIEIRSLDQIGTRINLQSKSRAMLYPFDRSDNARAVLILRESLRSRFDIPRPSRYDPNIAKWA